MAFRSLRDPLASFQNLQNQIGHAMERVLDEAVPGEWAGPFRMPALDVYDFADRYELHAEVPGVCVDTIDVHFLDGALTVRGEKKAPVGDDDAVATLRTERRYGTFSRSIELPKDIDAERIEARCSDGVLVVSIAKRSAASSGAVKVSVASNKPLQ